MRAYSTCLHVQYVYVHELMYMYVCVLHVIGCVFIESALLLPPSLHSPRPHTLIYSLSLEQEHQFRAKQFENAIADKARKILSLETEVAMLLYCNS